MIYYMHKYLALSIKSITIFVFIIHSIRISQLVAKATGILRPSDVFYPPSHRSALKYTIIMHYLCAVVNLQSLQGRTTVHYSHIRAYTLIAIFRILNALYSSSDSSGESSAKFITGNTSGTILAAVVIDATIARKNGNRIATVFFLSISSFCFSEIPSSIKAK